MTIVKKSLIVLLTLVVLVFGLELAVKHLSDFETFRTHIISELADRLQADVEIDRMGLDVLPRPHLELHDLRIGFVDGSALRVPVVNLAPTLKGLFSGRPEIVSISLEEPDARIVIQGQAPESVSQDQETRRKEQTAYIESLLQLVPLGITIYDGNVRLTGPDGTILALEDVGAETVATRQGIRVSVGCSSALWKRLSAILIYNDPGASLSLDLHDIDIVQANSMLNEFADEVLPAADIRQSLRGSLSNFSFKVTIPRVSDPLKNADISGRGSFEDVSVSFPDRGLHVRELDGDFELDDGNIAVSGISARLEDSYIQEATLHLDGSREFAPSLATAEFTFDLSDVPGWLQLIPDVDVRSEIALITNPSGTATGTFELRSDGDDYSTEITVRELALESRYRNFPSKLELQRGTCTYRDDLLSFENFSGKLGSSKLPDFSLSFGMGDDEPFTAVAKGSSIVFADLRMVLDSFDGSRELIEIFPTSPDGRITLEILTLEGPLTKPESWAIAVEGWLDDVSIAAEGLDGPLAISKARIKADEKTCALSKVHLTYIDAELSGNVSFDGYFNGISAVTAEAQGQLGAKALAGIQSLIDMPSVLALRAPVKVEGSRFEWIHDGPTTVSGAFVFGDKTRLGLNLKMDSAILEIEELKIHDAVSQCKFGMKIEEDILSLSYAGMLKKDTLDRVLLNNRFLQGWVQGDMSALFNQKNPRGSSAKGKIAWEKVGYPAFDALPITLTSAEINARNSVLTVKSAGLSTGLDSASLQGSVGFTDEGFVLDLTLDAPSIDVDAFTDRLFSDNASDDSNAKEFWETPLRGTVRINAQELKKGSFVCNPFEALVSFADKAVTVNTGGTKLCAVGLPATALITPDIITLDVRAEAEKSPMQEVVLCLFGEDELITGTVDIAGEVRAQAASDALLDNLDGEFIIHAQDGRIYRSGLIAKIVSYLSIRNLLTLSIGDMVQSGYAYQSLDIAVDINGQTLEVSRAVLISDSFTLVLKGIIDLESDRVNLDALVTPFQVHNQVLSRVPLVGGWLSKPMLGVPLKIEGSLGEVHISTRTASAVTKTLSDITRGIIKVPVKIISPLLPKKKSSDEK